MAEGQLDGAGHRTAAELAGVAPVVMIEPAAAARCMQHVRLVLCAAHVRPWHEACGPGGGVVGTGMGRLRVEVEMDVGRRAQGEHRPLLRSGALRRWMPASQLVVNLPTHRPPPRSPFLGSQTVTDAGGTVGDIGTLTYAMAAAAHHTPFCVTAPHYAFQQSGVPADETLPPPFAMPSQTVGATGGAKAAGAPVQMRPSRDVTPPKLVTWYFTDIGVLPPAAVVDWQLTHLYSESV